MAIAINVIIFMVTLVCFMFVSIACIVFIGGACDKFKGKQITEFDYDSYQRDILAGIDGETRIKRREDGFYSIYASE